MDFMFKNIFSKIVLFMN